jgi:hypothetical protein
MEQVDKINMIIHIPNKKIEKYEAKIDSIIGRYRKLYNNIWRL